MVKYQSTRGKEKFVLSHEAIIEGLAKDGGLEIFITGVLL